MGSMKIDTYSVEADGSPYQMVKITPPQTNDADIAVGKGAYCFVIDVSGRCRAAHAPPQKNSARPSCSRATRSGLPPPPPALAV